MFAIAENILGGDVSLYFALMSNPNGEDSWKNASSPMGS